MTRKTSWDKSTIVSEAHEYDIVVTKREIFLHSYYDGEEDGGVDYRVANKFLKNVPEKAIYNWDPGAHFGVYRPCTFWFDNRDK